MSSVTPVSLVTTSPRAARSPYCEVVYPPPGLTVQDMNSALLTISFWECPTIKSFWQVVTDVFNNLEITFPLSNFNDIILFSKKGNHDIQLIFHHNFMTLLTRKSPSAQVFDEHLSGTKQRLILKFNELNYNSFLILPHHIRYIDNCNSNNTRRDKSTNGLLARYHLLQPMLTYDLNNPTDSILKAYSLTWCKNNTLGELDGSKIKYKPVSLEQNLHNSICR